jgi:hypothetical protein
MRASGVGLSCKTADCREEIAFPGLANSESVSIGVHLWLAPLLFLLRAFASLRLCAFALIRDWLGSGIRVDPPSAFEIRCLQFYILNFAFLIGLKLAFPNQ